jgi:hypothetical protein
MFDTELFANDLCLFLDNSNFNFQFDGQFNMNKGLNTYLYQRKKFDLGI